MIQKIASYFPEDTPFTLVDFRDSMTITQVFRRVWARHGFATVEVTTVELTLAEIVAHSVALEAPIAYVVRKDAPQQEKEKIACAFGDKCALFVQEHRMFEDAEGELFFCGDPVPPVPTIPNRTILTVEGAFKHDFPHITLPKTLEVECPVQRGCYLGIRAKAQQSTVPLPVEAWFYLAGPQRGTLEIGIIPRRDGADIWSVRYAGKVAAQVSPPPHGPISGKLAVVLDRTCPDRSNWRNARDVALGTFSSLEETMSSKMGFGVDDGTGAGDEVGATVSYPGFNREIRTAIGPGLTAALDEREITVHAAWFADVGCEGLQMPEGVQPPERAYSLSGQSDAKGAQHLFSAMTYSPGIDLWDAAEQGLTIGMKAIENDPAGVIIIGNSPPTCPTQAGPLRNLNRVELGRKDFYTSARDSNPAWYEQLKRGKDLGIPIVYIFLTHDDLPDSERISEIERSQYFAYLHMQTRLLDALASCEGLKVITAKADQAGVQAALGEAVTWMESPTARLAMARVLA
ncbi:hypothetical protein KP003_14215 [Geomonas nitrogeniifigens]|uniref:hypothetical protein n=1 Tax=Geomonas diazotrophica TaxID=2843197 RepID=UPI001C2C8D05|nr:hypothetical protein [Geomonas nitrogeniifigens]QXE85531.1 hypothetical protein KP003_14215 [Geomonas nitrogeniifigens]